jgi:hypothetical protein
MTRKMRVFELAKELSLEPKEILRIAKDLAISAENAMSVLDAMTWIGSRSGSRGRRRRRKNPPFRRSTGEARKHDRYPPQAKAVQQSETQASRPNLPDRSSRLWPKGDRRPRS